MAAGLAHEKLDGQPLEVVIGVWKQLHSDQCHHPLPLKQVQVSEFDRELTPYALISSPNRGGVEVPGIGQRPFVELAIHWSSQNVQRVLALVDTGGD